MSRNGGRRYRQDLLGKLFKKCPEVGRVKETFQIIIFFMSIKRHDI
jgi:hypothetical protein